MQIGKPPVPDGRLLQATKPDCSVSSVFFQILNFTFYSLHRAAAEDGMLVSGSLL